MDRVERRLKRCDNMHAKIGSELHQAYLDALDTDIIIPKIGSVPHFDEFVFIPMPEGQGFRHYSENPTEGWG